MRRVRLPFQASVLQAVGSSSAMAVKKKKLKSLSGRVIKVRDKQHFQKLTNDSRLCVVVYTAVRLTEPAQPLQSRLAPQTLPGPPMRILRGTKSSCCLCPGLERRLAAPAEGAQRRLLCTTVWPRPVRRTRDGGYRNTGDQYRTFLASADTACDASPVIRLKSAESVRDAQDIVQEQQIEGTKVQAWRRGELLEV